MGLSEEEAAGRIRSKWQGGALLLKDPDFNTARLIAKSINERYPDSASASDPGAVVICPLDRSVQKPDAVSRRGWTSVCALPDVPARVVINERTGTIVAGENVSISSTAIAHGNLYIGVSIVPVISQPAPVLRRKDRRCARSRSCPEANNRRG